MKLTGVSVKSGAKSKNPMKPATTLKEILKPPFNTDCVSTNLINVYENGKQLQDEFKEFITQALNEKWERDFGEPLRLIIVCIDGRNFLRCPKCDDEHYMGNDIQDNNALIRGWKYCPHCGQRLLSSEENSNG